MTFLTCTVGYRYCESQTKSSHIPETKPRQPEQATWLQMLPLTPVFWWAFICHSLVTSCYIYQLEGGLIYFCPRQSVNNPELLSATTRSYCSAKNVVCNYPRQHLQASLQSGTVLARFIEFQLSFTGIREALQDTAGTPQSSCCGDAGM